MRNSSVNLIFHGLMGYFYDAGKCEIGFHPGDGDHKTLIELWQKPHNSTGTTGCKKILGFPVDDRVKQMELNVTKATRRVDFYKPGARLNRLTGPPEDFRWLIDLEEPGYYSPTNRKPRKFKPVLRVNDGTFYTRMVSQSTFRKVDSRHDLSTQPNATPLGHVALLMAAAINLSSQDSVSLQLTDDDGNTLTEVNIYQQPGLVFDLVFSNVCHSEPCPNPEPCHDEDESARNDFHFVRKVLDLPSGRPKYSIALNAAVETPSTCPTTANLKERLDVDFCGYHSPPRLTDEAPCSGAGYGGSGGCNC
jgi:hypothetical protein